MGNEFEALLLDTETGWARVIDDGRIAWRKYKTSIQIWWNLWLKDLACCVVKL